jgi:hypothetical protein
MRDIKHEASIMGALDEYQKQHDKATMECFKSLLDGTINTNGIKWLLDHLEKCYSL